MKNKEIKGLAFREPRVQNLSLPFIMCVRVLAKPFLDVSHTSSGTERVLLQDVRGSLKGMSSE